MTNETMTNDTALNETETNKTMANDPTTSKTQKLLALIKTLAPVNQADFFDLGILTFTDDVRAMCEQNTCGRFGRAWNCPPVCGSVAELEAACKSFERGILINTVTKIEDSFDWEGMMAGARDLYELLLEVDRTAEKLGVKHRRVFGSGGCNGCEECCYPEIPCRHPDKVFTPIEACGINVMQLAKDAGFKYINGQNTVTYFGMVLLGDEPPRDSE